MDGIEADLNGQADVLRLDILSEFGRAAAGQFGVQAVPTLLVVDGQGQIVQRSSGIPNRGAITEIARGLLTE